MKNGKLTKFDESTRQGHFYLRAEDDCFYLIESTAGKGFDHSDANGLISNFKKKPSVKGTYQWRYKLTAIRAAAETRGMNHNWSELMGAFEGRSWPILRLVICA